MPGSRKPLCTLSSSRHRSDLRTATASRLIRTSTEMVKLFTNNGTEQLLVHKNLLCHFSLYHYRLLNGPFLEGTYPSDKPIAVDTSLRVFNLFFTWLYSGTVDECPKGENGHMWDENMVDLYVLADSFNCTALQRTIISTQPSLQPNSTHLPCFTTLARLADKYLALAPLYQYFLDAYAQHWNGIWKISNSTSIEVVDPMPENFAFVALSRALQHKTEPCKCCQGRCAYHGHERKKNATPASLSDMNADCPLTR